MIPARGPIGAVKGVSFRSKSFIFIKNWLRNGGVEGLGSTGKRFINEAAEKKVCAIIFKALPAGSWQAANWQNTR